MRPTTEAFNNDSNTTSNAPSCIIDAQQEQQSSVLSDRSKTSFTSTVSYSRKQHILDLLKDAARQVVLEEDPWAKNRLEELPAERVIRHIYDTTTQTWTTDETIVKIEPVPFTRGAMRVCFRMKKRAVPPKTATNHRFHRHGWKHALNYVAKAYQKTNNQNGTVEIDTSQDAKDAVKNDILLQHEAQRWAERFNESGPPTKILFLRAYAIEFPDRPNRPWLAVERFISGKDGYGASFVKHNTNSGFVDTELRRVTPQVFSAHSFFASEGTRLVADIQGVGDMYTDPQVLSSDYRFGDGDLGPRGMALFFRTFRSCGMSDAMGIPIFPLSKNELKVQSKYEEDEITLSDEDEMSHASHGSHPPLDRFQRLDLNRIRRSSALFLPPNLNDAEQRTEVRSNLTKSRALLTESLRNFIKSNVQTKHASSPAASSRRYYHRSHSDVDEVTSCLNRAQSNRKFSMADFRRRETGELRERQFRNNNSFHKSDLKRQISAPMMPSPLCLVNLGKVHYQLAVLHGMERFPEVVPQQPAEEGDPPSHDAFSVLFHLSFASSLQNAPACLALARVLSGLSSSVSDLLQMIVPTDFEAAKDLLHRAMASPQESPVAPKVAAGCLLFQILQDELRIQGDESCHVSSDISDEVMINVLTDTLKFYDDLKVEQQRLATHQQRKTLDRGNGAFFLAGDHVEANFALEGTFYPAVVLEVSSPPSGEIASDDPAVTVQYSDDGTVETLPCHQVRPLIPPTATQTNLGGPLSDAEAYGDEGSDDSILLTYYELQAELAHLKATAGDRTAAAALFEQAADGAMADGKMALATKWSLQAAELLPS